MSEAHRNVRLRPENELLLCCARTRLSPEKAERLRELLRGGLDWPRLLATASRHGLLPLLYWQLRASCAEMVPPAWLAVLSENFDQLAQRNLYLSGVLCTILEKFDADGIRAIPVKGPTLAATVYGHLALREFEDLDILLREADVGRAHAALISLDYQPQFDPARVLPPPRLCPFGQYRYAHKDGEVAVELHSEATLRHFPVPFDLVGAAARLAPTFLGGRRILTLCPEDLLIFLCVHGAKDFWEQLKWICDVAELVDSAVEINWEIVFDRARRLDCERMLFLGLCLARDLLGAPLPGHIVDRVQAHAAVTSLAGCVREQLFRDDRLSWPVWSRWKFRLQMRERLLDGLLYCFRLAAAPNEEDYAEVSLPARFASFYSVVRLGRLAGALGVELLRGLSFGGAKGQRMPAESSEPHATRQGSRHAKQPFSARIMPAPDVLVRSVEGESILLDLRGERYFQLNSVGSGMWVRLTQANSIEAAYRVMLEEYDVYPERLRQDLDNFVECLLEHRLIEIDRA